MEKVLKKYSEQYYCNKKDSKRNINGGEYMKLDSQKFNLERARACMGQADFEKAGIPKGTLCRAMSGKGLKPETIGKIAKAHGVDVTAILED